MGPSLQALENQYFLLRSSLPTLTAQGATQDQLDTLRSLIVQARTNYWTALNKTLHDDDPAVVALTSQMNAEQMNIVAAVQHLGNIAKVLDLITKAVDIGSQIVAKAVSL